MKQSNRRPVAVFSDHPLFREGLVELLRTNGFENVFEHETSRDLLEAAQVHPPEVLVIDLDHEREDTMSLLHLFRSQLPKTRLVVIGTALRQEAAGATKSDSSLETAAADATTLAAVAAFVKPPHTAERQRLHQQWLMVTPRRRDVLRWLATGIDNQTIAQRLRISERAVKAHLSALLEIFGVENRTQLALIADHAGLRPPRVRSADKQAAR